MTIDKQNKLIMQTSREDENSIFILISSSRNCNIISSKWRNRTYGAGAEEDDPIELLTLFSGAAMSLMKRLSMLGK